MFSIVPKNIKDVKTLVCFSCLTLEESTTNKTSRTESNVTMIYKTLKRNVFWEIVNASVFSTFNLFTIQGKVLFIFDKKYSISFLSTKNTQK